TGSQDCPSYAIGITDIRIRVILNARNMRRPRPRLTAGCSRALPMKRVLSKILSVLVLMGAVFPPAAFGQPAIDFLASDWPADGSVRFMPLGSVFSAPNFSAGAEPGCSPDGQQVAMSAKPEGKKPAEKK